MPHKDLPNGRSYVTKYSSYVLLYARSNKSFVHRNVGETHELEATVRVENIDEFLKTKDGPDLNQVEYMFIRPYQYTWRWDDDEGKHTHTLNPFHKCDNDVDARKKAVFITVEQELGEYMYSSKIDRIIWPFWLFYIGFCFEYSYSSNSN